MSIKRNVLVTTIVSLALLAIISLLAIVGLNSQAANINQSTASSRDSASIQQIQSNVISINFEIKDFLALQLVLPKENSATKEKTLMGKIDSAHDRLIKIASKSDIKQQARDIQIADKELQKLKARITSIAQAIENPNSKNKLQSYINSEKEIDRHIANISTKLQAATITGTIKSTQLNSGAQSASSKLMLAIIIIAILSVTIGFYISHAQLKAISHSAEEMNSIGLEYIEGNHSRRIDSVLPVEFTSLANAFNEMAETVQSKVTSFEEAERTTRDFQVLSKASKTLNSLLRQKDIAKCTVKYVNELLDADAIAVLMRNDKSGKFRIKSIKTSDEKAKQIVSSLTSKELVNHAIKTRELIALDDRYERSHKKNDTACAGLVAPLIYKDHSFGAICLASTKNKQFNQHDMQLLRTVAGLASTALHNIYLLNQVEYLYIETVKAFVQAIEAKDSYTRGHSENVAIYATAIAQELNLPTGKIKALHTAALLHDIGKIGIKEEILNKPGRLNADEYEHIKMHPQISFQILRHMPNLKDLATIVLHHHERYDGTGYPEKLAGINIPFEARILAVADAFDAMTSSRPYKHAVVLETARNELLKEKGTQFDPRIVDSFIYLIDNKKIGDFSNVDSATQNDKLQEKAI